jgi:NAD(P)-dependent dehydrogenase (short-subunit alcohol dehydrogenase family)
MTNALFDLTGRSALVTGSGSGIAAAVASALAGAGAAVLVSVKHMPRSPNGENRRLPVDGRYRDQSRKMRKTA